MINQLVRICRKRWPKDDYREQEGYAVSASGMLRFSPTSTGSIIQSLTEEQKEAFRERLGQTPCGDFFGAPTQAMLNALEAVL